MKILVTGGAGFIGSHVVDAYVKAGHAVSVLDNLSTGSMRNVNPKAKFYKTDVRNLGAIERIFQKIKPHVVNHHAARIETVASQASEHAALETNVNGTRHVIMAFIKHSASPGRKIIFASSVGVYGNSKKLPVNEQTPPCPISLYGLTKILGEELMTYFAQKARIPYVILRYANIYGPRQQSFGEAGVVPLFFKRMKANVRPTIYGNGSKTRDYVFVEDIATANKHALTRGRNEIITLGTARGTTDKRIYDCIAQALAFSKKPRYKPVRSGEIIHSRVGNARAKKILGWKPGVTLEQGIQKTVAEL